MLTRREVLAGSTAFIALSVRSRGCQPTPEAISEGRVDQVAPDVYFHEGQIAHDYCNQGWIIFEDFVLLIDANFPAGAQIVLPKIRALTDKPIRVVFDTHHHGDHAYGNQFWANVGAIPVAHSGTLEELRRHETGFYGGRPGRWEEEAADRTDVRTGSFKPPSMLFPDKLICNDNTHRVELLHLGLGHTQGDAVAWLPTERILFTGDLCVNGPYNFVRDGDTKKWIDTLEVARRLDPRVICPGHGPRGAHDLLDDQQRFFKALRSRVQMLVRARKTPQEVLDSVAEIRATLAGDKKVARFVQDSPFNFFPGQVEKVYTELTGRRFPVSQNSGWGPRPGNFREKDVTSSSSDLGRDLPLAAHLRS